MSAARILLKPAAVPDAQAHRIAPVKHLKQHVSKKGTI